MEKLITEILNYFNAELIKENNKEYLITKNNNKILISDLENKELDIFVYLHNDNKKYIQETTTFIHESQKERFYILNEYYKTNNFYKFRTSFNKLIKDSYYLGHPLSFNFLKGE